MAVVKDWSQPDADSKFVVLENSVRMHYKREGRGPALLLLHGTASSLHTWDRVTALLAHEYEVIRVDLPAFGLTGARTDRDYRIEAYVETVRMFADAINLRSFAIAGNSLGGQVAWTFALDHPERLTGLILINATGYPDKSIPADWRWIRLPGIRSLLRRGIPRRFTERGLRTMVGLTSTVVDDAFVDRVHSLSGLPGNRGAFVDFVNTEQQDRSGEIKRINVPSLMLKSAAVDGQHFARDIRGCEEALHQDGGHLLPDEDPEWLVGELSAFLHNLSDTVERSKIAGRK